MSDTIFPIGLPTSMLPQSVTKIKRKNKNPKDLQNIRDLIDANKSPYGRALNAWKDSYGYEEVMEYTKNFKQLTNIERAMFHPEFRKLVVEANNLRNGPVADLGVGFIHTGLLIVHFGKEECYERGNEYISEQQWPLGMILDKQAENSTEAEIMLSMMREIFGALSHVSVMSEDLKSKASNALFSLASTYNSQELLIKGVRAFPQLRKYYESVDINFDEEHDFRLFDISAKYTAQNLNYFDILSSGLDDIEIEKDRLTFSSPFNLADAVYNIQISGIADFIQGQTPVEIFKKSIEFNAELIDLIHEKTSELESIIEENKLFGVAIDRKKIKELRHRTKALSEEFCDAPMSLYMTIVFVRLIKTISYSINSIERHFKKIQDITQENTVLSSQGLSTMNKIQENNNRVAKTFEHLKASLKKIESNITLNSDLSDGIQDYHVAMKEAYRESLDRLSGNVIIHTENDDSKEENSKLNKEKEGLLDENNKLKERLSNSQAELKDLRAKLFDLEKQGSIVDEPSNSVSIQDCKAALSSIFSGKGTSEDVLSIVAATCENVVILKSAYQSAKEVSSFKGVRRLYELLNVLHDDYMPVILSGQPDSTARDVLGGAYRANESDTVMANESLRKQREFVYNGKKHLFTKHLALGITQGNCIRLYFDIDQKTNKLVIAYCGDHLGTVCSS